MPLLGPDDALPECPKRVVVNGSSGAGKSTLARRISALWHLPYTELDALYHGPGWTPQPDFVERVEELSSGPAWVCEFQYDAARPLLAARADVVVWLDTAPHLMLWRVARRTLTRRFRREELWNGNTEAPLRTFFTDREHVVRWAWRTRHDAAERISALLGSEAGLPVVHLRSPRDVQRWLGRETARRHAHR